MFQSRMRRKGKKTADLGRKHMRLFPKKADATIGKPRHHEWLAGRRQLNYMRTCTAARRLGFPVPSRPIL